MGGLRSAGAWALRRVQELADPLLRGDGTVPPRRLRVRAGAPGAHQFIEGGRLAAAELAAGIPMSEVTDLLDFGCGAGRVLPHMVALAPNARCTGCDVDDEAIAWAQEHLPRCRWVRTESAPPLAFADGRFDLVYSISVFSHLDEDLQDRWLAELARILRPGSVALLTVHGPHAFEEFREGRVRSSWCRAGAFARDSLAADEFVFEPYVRTIWNRGRLRGVGSQYGLAFHGLDYLRARWEPFFDVTEVRERAVSDWQDLVVCRSRTG